MSSAPFKVRRFSLKNKVSPEEWEVRCDLAAVYRLMHHAAMTDRINTHVSARVPGGDGNSLLNPVGLLFDEVTASNLVRIDRAGNKMDPDNPYDVNPAGYVIHSAVLDARADVRCVIHHHSPAGVAVSALAEGVLPVSQHSLQFYNRVGFVDYEGFATQAAADERTKIAHGLGNHKVMFLRNHGVVVAGRTVGETYTVMDDLEQACRSQIMALSTGRPLHLPPPDVCEKTAQQFVDFGRPRGETEWPALRRLLDRMGSDYAT
ncbi:MAG: class II aldolase/adducin family protein [Alphaproteobacteria bacterium]|nr:class II aldolase/adducin family protein [Alphaproteobacteria bacterium]